jgi:hypothetical protein
MPLRLSTRIARVKRAEGLDYLDVNFNFVDGIAFDRPSRETVNGLRNMACDTLDTRGTRLLGIQAVNRTQYKYPPSRRPDHEYPEDGTTLIMAKPIGVVGDVMSCFTFASGI